MKRFCLLRREHGGVNAEYALAAAILMGVFVAGANFITERAAARMEASEEVVKGFTPCTENYGGLLSRENGECK